MNFRDTVYWSIYEKIFQFHKRFYNAKSESEWAIVIEESKQLCKLYQNKLEYVFVKDLVLAIINELERSSQINGEVIRND